MNTINSLRKTEALALTKKRKGEIRIGEMATFFNDELSLYENLKKNDCKFVLLGIPEDIGVRANFGRGGAYSAWKPALENILSIQSNNFFSGRELMILGEINLDDLVAKSKDLSTKIPAEITQLRNLTSEIDKRVFPVIELIISLGKIPIVIGGGHNNTFGILKGCNLGLQKLHPNKKIKVHAINCDAHTDFRPIEGRHSGNGFSYAFENDYLNKYAVIGVHENYLTSDAEQKFNIKKRNLLLSTYEDIFIREKISFEQSILKAIQFLKNNSFCGIEIDLDAITNVPSSAKTSSGISPVQGRKYIYNCAQRLNAMYLHIAEGAPVLAHLKADNKTGKLIGYLVTDFIKGVIEKK